MLIVIIKETYGFHNIFVFDTLLNYIITYNSYLVDSFEVVWLTAITSANNDNCVFYLMVYLLYFVKSYYINKDF